MYTKEIIQKVGTDVCTVMFDYSIEYDTKLSNCIQIVQNDTNTKFQKYEMFTNMALVKLFYNM